MPEKSDKVSVSAGQGQKERNEVEDKETTSSNEAISEEIVKEAFETYFAESDGVDASADVETDATNLSTLFETSDVSMSDFDGKVLNQKG